MTLQTVIRRFTCALPALAVGVTLHTPAQAENIRLSLPVACVIGETCFIQSYVDRVPGKGTGDYACGQATYDGHKGTDFRVLSVAVARKKVSVLAAAPGRVLRVRDGVADKLTTGKDDTSVKGKECGNGIVIEHADGWQTQYCHLLKGSVAVANGERVSRGARLGAVGFSGAAQFAHLHITLRHNGKVVDPFLTAPVATDCALPDAQDHDAGLWDVKNIQSLAYKNGELIEHGFAGAPVNSSVLERGVTPRLSPASAALVYYVRFINLHKGDVIRLNLNGPGGFTVRNQTKPLARTKAQYVAFIGKKRRAKAWSSGIYTGTVDLVRDGTAVTTATVQIVLPSEAR